NGNVTGGGSFTLTNTLADTESGAASSTTAALGGAYGGTLYLDGAQSAVDSSSYQLTPGTPPSQGAAPSAAVGPAGGISGTFTYVYVTNDGSGHYVASAPSNQLSLSNAKATITGREGIVEPAGGGGFPAGSVAVQARVRSGSSLNGQAVLSAAMYVVDSSGSVVSTVFGPTDGSQQIQNVGTAGIVASVNGTSSSATTIGAAQHLCVHFWRHQTTGYTSGGSAARTISIVAYDPSNEISAHPAPTISGWSDTPLTVSTPAGRPFLSKRMSSAQRSACS